MYGTRRLLLAMLLASAILLEAPAQSPPGQVASVAVRASESVLFGVGATTQLIADVVDENGAAVPDAPLAWTSSDPDITTVDESGKVTAAGFGVVTITAVCGQVNGTRVLRVLPELPPEAGPWSPVAFVNVNVVPMDEERVLERQTVIIRYGQIEAVGPVDAVEAPEDAERVECESCYLMPGLADMHTHLVYGNRHWDNDLFLFLANGVTATRVMWGSAQYLSWREAIASGAVVGPRLFVASPGMDGPTGHWAASEPPITTPAQAWQAVAAYKRAGYDWIKIYTDLTPEVFAAVMEAARAHGMKVVGHPPTRVGFLNAAAAGQYSMEHLMGIGEMASSTGSTATGDLDPAILAEAAAVLRDAGVWSTPTLAIATMSQDRVPELRERPEMRFVSPQFKAWFDDPRSAGPSRRNERRENNLKQIVKALREAGARLLLGVDSGFRYALPGYSIHDELEMMVGAGLTPYQVIRTGTADAAEFLERAHEMGTVEAGKRADLILLQENPLADVAKIRKRAGVMAAGRWFSEKRLREKLEGIALVYGN